jgi:hypothetical protein
VTTIVPINQVLGMFFWFMQRVVFKGKDCVTLWYQQLEMEQARAQGKTLRIASRIKLIDGVKHEPGIVVLSHSNLERHFSSPLQVAARDLGVCTTALKRYYFHASLSRHQQSVTTREIKYVKHFLSLLCSACRTLGIKNWPYRKVDISTTLYNVCCTPNPCMFAEHVGNKT